MNLPSEVFVERFGAEVGDTVGDQVMWTEEWAAFQGGNGLLQTRGNCATRTLLPTLGVIVSLEDDYGSKVSVQWKDGQLSRGLSCGKACQWDLVYA